MNWHKISIWLHRFGLRHDKSLSMPASVDAGSNDFEIPIIYEGTINMKHAVMEDLDWISDLVNEGVRDRHFSPMVMSAFGINEFSNIINRNEMRFLKTRNNEVNLASVIPTLFVAEIKDVKCAFLLVFDYGDELELYIAATHKNYRRNGAIRLIINHVMKQNSGKKITARCYLKSTYAISLLEKMNFQCVSRSEEAMDFLFSN